MKILYGTTNPAKLEAMRLNLDGTEIEIEAPTEAVDADESGKNPIENARIKAFAYFAHFRRPVFALDSGLYIDGLPNDEQPGTHVRRVLGKRLTDDEMIAHYAAIARRMGGFARAQYRNAICLILGDSHIYEHDGEDIASEAFYLCQKPHQTRIEGFPLDSLSVIIDSGDYYYDARERYAKIVGQKGYALFFQRALKDYNNKQKMWDGM